MFPYKQELKLQSILQFYTKLKIRRARKNVNRGQIPLFELTEEEKEKFIKELVSIAIEVNKSVFNDFVKAYDVDNPVVNKQWVKNVYTIATKNIEVEQLKAIQQKRITDMAKKLDIKIAKNGTVSKTQLKALRANTSRYRTNKEIREIMDKLESGKFDSKDIDDLTKWLNRRNELIARNETGNIYAQEVKDLLIRNGQELYVWRTMQDSRVRHEHRAKDGKTYSINEGILPGEDFNCRCWAEPVK